MEAELGWGDRAGMDNYADSSGASGAGIVTFFSFEVAARPASLAGKFGVEATAGGSGTTTLLFSVADVIANGTTGLVRCQNFEDIEVATILGMKLCMIHSVIRAVRKMR